MKNQASKPWRLNINGTYKPFISILVPMSNEEKTIRFKLENLLKVKYPAEKIQIILVDDASTDATLNEVSQLVNSSHVFNIKILQCRERVGKSNSLNFALKHATGEIIVVSDADCFWLSDILVKALPYLSESSVGAIAGKELLLNPGQSWTTRGERVYNSFVQTLRLGESKVDSTIFFQGGFSAYKRALLDEFDRETDDSGTALDIVQKRSRTLLIPEAIFYTMFPTRWKSKVAIKLRRANQLQRIWIKCLKSLFQGKLALARRVAIPEIYFHIFSPLVFLALAIVTAFLVIEQPLFLLAFLPVFLLTILIPRSRFLLVEMIQNNIILLASMTLFIAKRRFKVWETADDSRSLLNEEILREKQLI